MTSTSNQNPLRELKLHSPAGVEPAVFTWPNIEQQKTNKDAVFIGGDEIVRTIRLVFEDYPQLYQQNLGLATCDIHSYSHMKELCDKFNKIIDTHIKLNRGTEAFSARLQQRPSSKLFRHILAQVYSRAVTDPDKLRDYEPFSPSVYGETSPDLIDSMLKLIELNEDQTFIDLGSGVGNVVLHVAALANCKHAYGIEHEETPSMYARAMADEFRSWMRWYGKRYSDFELERGDFLTHPTIDERIREADVIFVNNYVFGSTVNHELKVKFMNMKDGARIVSSREFCPETFRLNDRTKNDLGAVMHVTKPEALFGKVSWSDKSVQYYLHVIDHSKLALYYEKIHQMHNKGTKIARRKSIDDDRSLSPLSTNSSTTNGKMHRPVKSRKNDGEENDASHTKINSLKRPNSVSSVSGRGRKIRRKIHPDKINSDEENPSELESDLSNDGMRNVKQSCASSKDYHSTLNELHHAAEEYFQSHENQRFNYPKMTKLTDENLHLNHFRDCLIEQEDQDFFQSINKYLNRFRQRLFSYFTYMKSDEYREHLKQQLDNEKELNKTLKAKVNCLEASIKLLLEDAIDLLKVRTDELGIEKLERPAQLINYANDISSKHKELRSKVATLEQEIADYDHENERLASILTNMEKNGHSSVTSDAHSTSDNTYSTLLASMSRQTQQQEMKKSNELSIKINQNKSSQYETDSKADFIIEKRAKKSTEQRSNPPTLVSPIRIVKVNSIGKRSTGTNSSKDSPIALRIAHTSSTSSINNLLSSKQLEPVQVHSVISTSNQHLQNPPVVQSINVKSLLSTSPTSKLSSVLKAEEFANAMMIRSPRKKRDFYGKSTGPAISSTASSPSNHRSHRHGTSNSSPVNQKTRPSSTPACTTTTISSSSIPDRPTSIPPLRTSS